MLVALKQIVPRSEEGHTGCARTKPAVSEQRIPSPVNSVGYTLQLRRSGRSYRRPRQERPRRKERALAKFYSAVSKTHSQKQTCLGLRISSTASSLVQLLHFPSSCFINKIRVKTTYGIVRIKTMYVKHGAKGLMFSKRSLSVFPMTLASFIQRRHWICALLLVVKETRTSRNAPWKERLGRHTTPRV